MALTLGDLVPDLLGLDEAGQEVRLSDYPGRKIPQCQCHKQRI